jgi:hypothetical protein
MPSRRLTLPAVAALALACIALGILAALADGSGRQRPRAVAARPLAAAAAAVPRVVAATRGGQYPHAFVVRATRPVAVGALRPFVVAAGRGRYLRTSGFACGVVRLAGPVGAQAPKPEPVPDDLLHAFGILRRAATPADALPRSALTALRERGLEPFDPAAARLVRTTTGGGRAWVVPTRDVPDTTTCGASALPIAPPAIVYNPKAPAIALPVPVPPRREAAPRGRAPRYKPDPARPGLALVGIGDAPVGAGGRYEDLIRGREDVSVAPCSGPDHDMSSVSGLVPDGVPAAFLTSPDGTAIRADVRDNAYTFVVPMPTRAEDRYVVWTGGDGTPHVQPLPPTSYGIALRCNAVRHLSSRLPTVSPSPVVPLFPAPVAITPKRHK